MDTQHKAQGTAKDVLTSFRLSVQEHADLKRIAEVDRRSLSNELRFLIERRAAEIETLDREAA